jgi:hypothetical protein
MQQFKISEEAYRKFRKKWYTMVIPLVVVPIVVVIILTNLGGTGIAEVNTLPFVIPFVLLLVGFSFYLDISYYHRVHYLYHIQQTDRLPYNPLIQPPANPTTR